MYTVKNIIFSLFPLNMLSVLNKLMSAKPAFAFAKLSQLKLAFHFLFAFCTLFRVYLNPVWHGTGHFYPVEFVRSNFVSWFFFKISQTFLEVKIEINWIILTPWPAHWVLQKLPLGSSKDEHFSCFVTPCQKGLRPCSSRPYCMSL